MSTDLALLVFLFALLMAAGVNNALALLSGPEITLFKAGGAAAALCLICLLWEWKSSSARKRREMAAAAREVPEDLRLPKVPGVRLGKDLDLGIEVYLPDAIRARHVHIVGATGSGKTESVILNCLRQDVERGLGSIILDAKGDASFLVELTRWLPRERLRVFDLSAKDSLPYDPLRAGSPLEAAQRLFSSLTWSEEYYQAKAFYALQQLFEKHFALHSKNPRLSELASYLENEAGYVAFALPKEMPKEQRAREYSDLSGLVDQIRALSCGHLANILSPISGQGIELEGARDGLVLYFRLQSLLSPRLVGTVGRLLINHLGYLAGTAHRNGGQTEKITAVYLDEFASFACPEFADLISKARSAKFALHFAHQSVGDLLEVSRGFLSQITDNSATKIILRINDPDTADFFSRSFGTRKDKVITRRVRNAKDIDRAEADGVGSMRDVNHFRASPDLLKTLPTGVGAVLIAHGRNTPAGASSVFRIEFPQLKGDH
jgi:conjugal transfer pilus assembly protein TraD